MYNIVRLLCVLTKRGHIMDYVRNRNKFRKIYRKGLTIMPNCATILLASKQLAPLICHALKLPNYITGGFPCHGGNRLSAFFAEIKSAADCKNLKLSKESSI